MIPGFLVVRSLASVAVVIGLLLLFAWALRRGVLRIGPRVPRTHIVVETAVTLGERRSLVIVAVEGRRLLLGLSGGGIALLTELAPAKPDGGVP